MTDDQFKTCDACDSRINPTGYLGGPIVCRDCARKKREGKR